jgi:hypothetical protein
VSKEQYGFFYRSTTVTLLNHYLYNDTNNVFEREPYPALFRLLDGHYLWMHFVNFVLFSSDFLRCLWLDEWQ